MCTYSMVADHFIKQWPDPFQSVPVTHPWPYSPPPYIGPTKEQFQELLDLLKAAKRIDEATGQPDCELEDKKNILRAIAKQLGVEVQLP